MPKFRKKPIVIEAVMVGNIDHPIPEWLKEAFIKGSIWVSDNYSNDYSQYTIRTLEGDMRANMGEWIIRGDKGEIYPCKPDIFEMTYENVD